MSHLTRDTPRILGRVRRLRGQMEAVERALEAGTPCAEILQLVASIRGATAGLTAELIEEHLRHHVTEVEDATSRAAGADDLARVIRTYLK